MTLLHRYRSGFSLVELMFSMAVGSMVLILAAAMLGVSGDGYERVSSNVSSEREARFVMSQLTADLSSAQFHKETKFEKSSIGFFSLQPASAQSTDGHIGDLCALNYYLDDLDIGGKKQRCLMRGFRESKDTFDALRIDEMMPLFEKKAGIDEPIAFGVVSFQVYPKILSENGDWLDWVSNGTVEPEAVEIRLVIARRRLVAQLQTSADWDAAASSSKYVTSKNFEIYSTIIRIGNHASSR